MICLDTNVLIGLLNGRDPKLRARFEEQMAGGREMAVPTICLFEMRYGHANSQRKSASDLRLVELLASPFEPKAPTMQAKSVRL